MSSGAMGAATLKRLSVEIDAARRLAGDETADRVNSAHDADPESARQTLDNEYQPLLEGRGSHGSQRGADELQASTPVKRLETFVAYGCFFVLGAAILLPWHSVIVALPYFGSRLVGSSFQNSVASWTALAFTLFNVIFLARATFTHDMSASTVRIFISISLVMAALAVLCGTTRIADIGPTVFFAVLMASTILASAGASFLQNAVVGLSAAFGPWYLQGILSGQGAIGAIVASVQMVTAATATGKASSLAEQAEEERQIRNSAFVFFLISVGFTILAALAMLLLLRLPFYHLRIRATEQSEEDKQSQKEKPTLRQVEPKVRVLGLSVFYVFFVTLSCFPSITSSVRSTHAPPNQPAFYPDALWVPAGFLIFACGDWLGRALPQSEFFIIKNKRVLVIFALARTVFIPLFLLCNVERPPSAPPALINSDVAYLLILTVFAITNGYASTLIMMASLGEERLEKEEIDVAATICSLYLTSGLAAGSLASFPVRAFVCQCDPF